MKLSTPIKVQCQHCEHEQTMTEAAEQCDSCGNVLVAWANVITELADVVRTAASSSSTRRRYESVKTHSGNVQKKKSSDPDNQHQRWAMRNASHESALSCPA